MLILERFSTAAAQGIPFSWGSWAGCCLPGRMLRAQPALSQKLQLSNFLLIVTW